MKQELEDKLFDKYPNLYADKDLPMSQTAMCWGIACGDGWYDIIDRLSAKLEPMGIKAMQVKEKFGGLRFYIYGNSERDNFDEAYKYVNEAEAESTKTCEQCGKPGQLYGGRWLVTLCKDCAEKQDLYAPHNEGKV